MTLPHPQSVCLQSVFSGLLILVSCQRVFLGSIAHPARCLSNVSWSSSFATTKIIWWPPEMWIIELSFPREQVTWLKLHYTFPMFLCLCLVFLDNCQICWLFYRIFLDAILNNITDYKSVTLCRNLTSGEKVVGVLSDKCHMWAFNKHDLFL